MKRKSVLIGLSMLGVLSIAGLIAGNAVDRDAIRGGAGNTEL